MKKPRTIKTCVAVIQWDDACMLGKDQMGKDDPQIKLAHGFSAGVLVKETKDFICLALDKFDIGDTPFRTLQTYPKSGIKSIKRFNFSRLLETKK